MPLLQSGSITLNYSVTGQGPALVLIGGLGMTMQGWALQVRALSRHFQLVRMDNRGCGRSVCRDDSFSIQDMADDVILLLDHLGLEQVHLLGISMGGFIALDVALRKSHRVKSMILAHTAASVPELSRQRLRLWASMRNQGVADDILAREQLLWLFPESVMGDDRAVELLIRNLVIGIKDQSSQGFYGQAGACGAFDLLDRIQEIQAPAMIVSSDDDLSIPLSRTRELEALPGARNLKVFQSSGHVSHLIHANEFNRDVVEFIRSVESGGGGLAAETREKTNDTESD